MRENGYAQVFDAEIADVVVVNTCSVREKARHKAVSEVGRMISRERSDHRRIVVVAGCVAQQDGERWFEQIQGLDLVVGPDHYQDLPALVDKIRNGAKELDQTGFDDRESVRFLDTKPGRPDRGPIAFLTVMKGCSERCSYCIVPRVRGPQRCRPVAEVLDEAKTLVADGVKEIVLLGQKVNAYRDGEVSFAALLVCLDKLSGLERLRFTSPHPRHMDNDLIECYGRLGTLCESIHLPVQSGSDAVLARMRRRYTVEDFRRTVEEIRRVSPDCLISTDLIVGYPGETEAEFEETLNLVSEVQFAGAFSFKYSARPGTRAAEQEDDISEKEKSRRLHALHERIEEAEREVRQGLVGKRLEVLVEGSGRQQGQLSGRARNNQIVNFLSTASDTVDTMRGRLVEVEVVRALPHSLEGAPFEGE